jgi:hypothetical protein
MKWLPLVVALPALCAVDGIVLNRTTGKPQPQATVTIYKLGDAGMESIETVKSDDGGKFVMKYSVPGGPHLIQAAYDGVTYNKMVPPGTPPTGISVEVYNSQAKAGEAKVTQHMMLFEPVDDKLVVSENVIYVNSGNLTYNDPTGGTLRFYLPAAAKGKVKVMGSAPNGMPIERAAFPTKTENVFAVDFPVKPGETRFQLSYEMPLADPPAFRGRILHDGITRLVTPRGVALKGDSIEDLGREPQTQAAIYKVKGKEFQFAIEGKGALRNEASGEEGPGIQEILPRVYDRLYLVLGLASLILALGLIVLYRGGVRG